MSRVIIITGGAVHKDVRKRGAERLGDKLHHRGHRLIHREGALQHPTVWKPDSDNTIMVMRT